MPLQLGLLSYNIHVTPEELWSEVGRRLRDSRERQNKKWLHVSVDARERFHAKLDPKTIQAIERGEIGTVDKAELLARTLGLSIVDVLSATLKASEQRPTPEAAALLRCFEHLGVHDRRIVLETAQRLLEHHQARTRLERLEETAAATSRPKRARRPKPPQTT